MTRVRSRRLLLAGAVCAIAAVGYVGWDWLRWREHADAATGVAVELGPAAQVIRVGEEPQFVLRIVNRGNQAVMLTEPREGSTRGWTTPLIEWSRKPWVVESRFCLNSNPLKSEDVFFLKPGETRQLRREWLGVPHLSGKGRYKVSVRYANEPGKWVGRANHNAAAMERVRHSTPVVAVSNAVEIVVTE
jgi:hypothetical protein